MLARLVLAVPLMLLAPVAARAQNLMEEAPLPDKAARAVFKGIATSVEKNERAAFVALVAPGGLALHKKKVTRAALTARLEKVTVGAVTRFDENCQQKTGGTCTEWGPWRTSPGRSAKEFLVTIGSGYGVLPTARVRKQGASWFITEIVAFDHGAP
jgi:hypothetical protein